MNYKEFCEVRDVFEQHAASLTSAWQKKRKPVKAKFPRGCIRTYDELRPRWAYLDKAHQNLLCQMVQLCDVNRWNLYVWDLSGTAGAAYVWHSTIPVLAVIEVLCRQYIDLRKYALRNKRESFENFIWALHDNKVVDDIFSDELHRLRKYRNSIHLDPDKTPQIEGNGLPDAWNKACAALAKLEMILSDKIQSSPPADAAEARR